MWVTKAGLMLLLCAVASNSKNSNIRLTKYSGCPEVKTLVNFTEVILRKESIYFKALVLEDVIGEQKAEFSIERCLNRDSPSTCEKYHKIKIPFYCRVLAMGPWESFTKGTTPEWKCPFKKGLYVTKKSIPVKLSDLSTIYIAGGYYWKLNVRTYVQETNQLIICLTTEVQT